ncbi:MAG: type I-E CRISPR-associated endonuclease Cas1e [Candidatus Sumerlaea chitinivorans]|nr:type I-E CRISPR-associated endonuclease Cas1e [Candidatus Sumerlaea chitinivorans]
MIRLDTLRALPKVRDCTSMLYVEHAIVEREDSALLIRDAEGTTSVPSASLLLLMLGPGTSLTHEAAKLLSEQACTVAWTGEEGVRLYTFGLNGKRSASRLLHQAKMWADPATRLGVVRNLYSIRFGYTLSPDLTLQQIRGMEGMRVRSAYEQASRETCLPWKGRNYKRDSWEAADPLNRALSTANACLYGICNAAILAGGFSPAIGFIHTGNMLSFVFDIADLYKTEISIPVAFRVTASNPMELERSVRIAMRDTFVATHLLRRIIPDIQRALEVPPDLDWENEDAQLLDLNAPLQLWDPQEGTIESGRLHLPENETHPHPPATTDPTKGDPYDHPDS